MHNKLQINPQREGETASEQSSAHRLQRPNYDAAAAALIVPERSEYRVFY